MKRRTFISTLLAAGACHATPSLLAADPKSPSSLSIDRAASRLGVYLGPGCAGAGKLPAFEGWLGREVDQVIEFIGWDVLQASGTWGVKCWRKAKEPYVVYSLPMLPPKGSGMLKPAANGEFDDLYRRYAQALIANGYQSSVIRIGWEFNANWYPWQASKDPQAWIAYWRRIVATMRDTPGAKFEFDWCPAASKQGFNAEKAYPGDDVVDYIGLDYYNTAIDQTSSTPEQRWQARMNMQHGLKWHRDFARSHGKRMSLPEWGTGVHSKWGGPPDDPYFIESMAQWIADNKVAYHNYWEHKNKDYDSKLSTGRQPEAAAAFLKHFGGKGAGHAPSAQRMGERGMVS